MPRGSSRSRSSSPTSRSAGTFSRPAAFQPRPQPTSQPFTQQRPGMFSGFGSTLAQGMAFGAGSQVAHQAVRGAMGGNSGYAPATQHQPTDSYPAQAQQVQPSSQYQANPCQAQITMFTDCLNSNKDISYCQSMSDALKTCQQKYTSS